jgi:hypothetical protein
MIYIHTHTHTTQTHTHTHTHTHTIGHLNEQSAHRCRRYMPNIQQTKRTNMHDVSRIRTRNPRKRAAADLCLSLYSHQD